MAVGRVRVKCWLGREGGGLVSRVVRFWESSGGCGGGVSVMKVGLWELGAEGFGGGFWVESWVVSRSGRSTGELVVWCLKVYEHVLGWSGNSLGSPLSPLI